MRALLAAACFGLMSVNARAQGSYLICDTTEICICHDGAEELYYYVFNPCQPGWVVSLGFCLGDVPQNLFAAVFNGPTGVSPIMGTLIPPGPWDGEYFISTDPSGALTLRLSYSPASNLSCANGDYDPLVIWLIAGPPMPPPFPPFVCDGAGSSCLPTGIGVLPALTASHVTYLHGGLQFSGRAFTGEFEVHDMSGRLIDRQRVHGEQVVPLRASLASGTYLVTLLGATESDPQLITVP